MAELQIEKEREREGFFEHIDVVVKNVVDFYSIHVM